MNQTISHSHIKKTFTKQYSQYYCGLACLTSIVKYYGGETTQEKLRNNSGTTFGGTSLLGLYQSAQELGFEAKGYEADIESLKQIEGPVILHILKDGNLEHYVVCYGYENEKFIIGDPGRDIIDYLGEELAAVWKSKALLWVKPGKEFIPVKTQSRNKQIWFKHLIKDDIPVLLVAAFMGMVLSVLGLSVAIYTQKLIDKILPSGDTSLLFKSLGIFALILMAKALVGYMRGLFLVRQSKDMNIRIVSSFFAKLLFLPKNFFDSVSTGDMIGRLNDSQRIQRVVINLISNILIDVLIVIVSLVYVFLLSISTGLIALFSIPVFGLLALNYNRKVIARQREVMQTYALTESKYIETIQSIQVIKSGNKETLLAKAVQTIYNFFQGKVYELGILGIKINLWAQVSSVVLLSGLIFQTSMLVLDKQLLLGEMMAIVSIIGGMMTSAINIAMANIQFQEARVAFDRMYEFAAIEPEYSDQEVEQENIEIQELSIQNLSFRFPGKRLLLKDISITIQKGKIVTIFGEIGCGKSTLISILQRFYSFESGQVILNRNTNWNTISNKNWRNQTAYVSQKIKLFNGTILENIGMEEYLDQEKVVNFCQEIGLDPFISEFQQGYASVVNENSTNLSGGQQQLIALARALYQKPQILLLDEATASMDRKTEQFVIDLLNKLKKEMMIIFVTHRVQLAKQTDKIYIIENSQIKDAGFHEDLVIKNKLYKECFEEIGVKGKLKY